VDFAMARDGCEQPANQPSAYTVARHFVSTCDEDGAADR
jgi:hypothetical protein